MGLQRALSTKGSAPEGVKEVLVALWPAPRDREFARERGWYRVRPGTAIERLGDLTRFRTLAFYQPDSFGKEGRRVRFRAPIVAHERLTRAELLPEEPDHVRGRDSYHCFRLGPLEELPQPITSRKGRRLLFIPTTEARLALAREINELFAGTPIEDTLFRALRQDGLWPEREYYVELRRPEARGDRPVSHFLDLALFCHERDLDVECDGDTWHVGREGARRDRARDNLLEGNGWHILRFNTTEILEELPTVRTRIREAINRYGGIEQEPGVVRRFQRDGRLGPGQRSLDLFE
jgi:very-short-patch-repair endonuclease